jgi:probable HAF family extracellular repeat protein
MLFAGALFIGTHAKARPTMIGSFVYSDGHFTDLEFPGSHRTYAFGINDSGDVVGYYITGSKVHGFLYSDGNYTGSLPPGTGREHSPATTIVDTGDIYGFSSPGRFRGSDGYRNYIYSYSGGSFEIYKIIDSKSLTTSIATEGGNDAGQVVGWYNISDDPITYGFIHSSNGFESLSVPGNSYTAAYAINDAGVTVGYTTDDQVNISGFRYDNGLYSLYDVPSANITMLRAINNSGELAGSYVDSNIRQTGIFTYSAGS